MIVHDVVNEALEELRRRLSEVDEGVVADYIPELATADPAACAVALASMEGHRYHAGDAEVPVTVQSVSKPFVYALALSVHGSAEVGRFVGTEPSGEAFNAVSLDPETGRAANPMVNAGAIVTTALVPARSAAQRFERILTCLSRFAGRRLDVDEAVYRSELATGDRNRALAYLARSAGTLPVDPTEAVETYFRQCAVRATTRDLAVMAATLANGGVNPVTGDAVVPEPVAVQTLAVLATCGMYDASGDWLVRVGLPAKSGVSGTLIAASPGRFGAAVFSPPLDPAGNPVRGTVALRELSGRFGLHLMHVPAPGASTVVSESAPGLLTARGVLDFAGVERVLYALSEQAAASPAPESLTVDLRLVTHIDSFAAALLRSGVERLAATGQTVTVVRD